MEPGFNHRQSYEISNLKQDAEYECLVQARNKFGWSEASRIFHFFTGKRGKNTKQNQRRDQRMMGMLKCSLEGKERPRLPLSSKISCLQIPKMQRKKKPPQASEVSPLPPRSLRSSQISLTLLPCPFFGDAARFRVVGEKEQQQQHCRRRCCDTVQQIGQQQQVSWWRLLQLRKVPIVVVKHVTRNGQIAAATTYSIAVTTYTMSNMRK